MYVCLHAPTHVHVCRLARGSFVTWLAFIHSPVCVDGCIVAVVGMGPGEDTAFVGSTCLHRLICALAGHLSKMGNAFKKTERSFQDPVDPSSTAGVTRTRSVWVKHYDPDAKCHYYHNAKTGHSTWTEKELLAGLETIREQATVEAEDYASPEEWVRHYDDVSKHHYYSNKKTGRTTWTEQEILDTIMSQEAVVESNISTTTENTAAETGRADRAVTEWVEYYDQEYEQPYFQDPRTGRTTWTNHEIVVSLTKVSGTGGGGFLAEIRTFEKNKLKKAEFASPKPIEEPASFLKDIRSFEKNKLKKAKSPPKKVGATPTASNGRDLLAQLQVAMKSVRTKVEVSDDEDAWEEEGE